MAFPRRPSQTPRSRYTLIVLLLTAVTLIVVDLPGTGSLNPIRSGLGSAFRPVRSLGDTIFEPFSNGWRGAFGYGDLRDENDRLRSELDRIEDQAADIERLETKVRELERILDVSAGDHRLLTAEVISAPLSNWDQSVEIDQGSGDGVKKGMAVITAGNSVFGRITSTSGGRSTVELITEPRFEVGIRLDDGPRAVARGQGQGKPLVIDSIEAPDVEVGDFVYTSGVTLSAFPADLKIGEISVVEELPTGARRLEIEPLADLRSVYVKVVLKDPPP